MSNYLIGVDLGTTNVKSGIFDENGNLISIFSQEINLYHPKPGWAVQDLNEIFSIATKCIRNSIEKSKVNPKDIIGIAFDGQMSGLGAIDEKGDPAMEFDSWLDTKCTPYINYMKKDEELIIQKSGCPPTFSHAPKILWWKNEAKEVYKKIRKFVVPAVYIASKLGNLKPNDIFIDYTYIHFSNLADIQNMKWSEEICELYDIPIEKLPRIVNPWDVVGKISSFGKDVTGLLEGTPIIAGCGDQPAAMLGAGITEEGILYDSAGTASVLAITLNEYKPDLKYKTMYMARTVFPDLWYSIGFINGGGEDLRWFRDTFCLSEKEVGKLLEENIYNLLDKEAEKICPGSDGIIFIPHMGGRVCPSEPNIRGTWIGLNWGHEKRHLYRAILEGISYEYFYYLKIIKELFPNITFKKAVIVGGGAESKLWNTIKSSVLGVPYTKINRIEGAIFGSALLAGYGVGLFKDLKETLKKFIKDIEFFEPQRTLNEKYFKYATLYIKTIESLKGIFEELSKIREEIDKRKEGGI
jgi:xylulokinase